MENERLQSERDEYKDNLIELDNQHQIIIDEIMRSKNKLVEELRRVNAELTELKRERENDGTKERRDVKEKDEQHNEGERLQALAVELEEEKKKRKEASTEIVRLSETLRNMEEEKERLENDLEDTEKKLVVAEKLRHEVLSLRKEYEERGVMVKELNDRVVRQEEEILKLEAVLEEKNLENSNALRRLRQQEEVAQLALKEMKAENEELRSAGVEGLKSLLESLAAKCNVQSFEEIRGYVDELQSELASLRCERDRLSEELRDTQDMLEGTEADKTHLERDCEDLRDQLEELQHCGAGGRPSPEGSLTPRSLPTIEEEEPDQAEGNLKEKVDRLDSEATALREARQNLEMELSITKKEKGDLERRLTEANSQLGNLVNLEVEAESLRSENESLQGQEEGRRALERKVEDMTRTMNELSLDAAFRASKEEEMRHERDRAHEQLSAHNQLLQEYQHEVSRLHSLQTRSDPSPECQNKLFTLESELDKAKGLVIYKDDQIDQLKLGIDQIGEIFNLKPKDLRQTYVGIKQEYSNLMSELNALREENEKLREDSEEVEEKEEELEKLKSDLETMNSSRAELENSKEMVRDLEKDLREAKARLETLEKDKNNVSKSLEETVKEVEKLRTENMTSGDRLRKSEEELQNVRDERRTLESKLEERIKELEEQLTSKDCEIENLRKLTTAENAQAKDSTQEAEGNLLKLQQEHQALQEELRNLRSERQQMILTSTQKHQEAVTYYNEIQRLNEALKSEEVKNTLAINSQSEKLRELSEENQRLSETITVLKKHLEESKMKLRKVEEDSSEKEKGTRGLKEELAEQKDLAKNVTKERDQLRLANSSFNSQYEEKCKEVSALQERENHLKQEVQRLKQHLVEIEETYTSESVKSEQREASLRQSLAKMHEKLASNSTHYSTTSQRTVAQLESLQERLNEAVHERDDARTRLQDQEEALLQNQEALNRLQQVLQDFQKSQTKDIALATERERRKYEEERERKTQLEAEITLLQERLRETESQANAATSLGKELQAKENTIIELRSRVSAVTLAAKKSQEQIASLQSSSEAKVDKHLLRNLIVGYFATPSDKQREVLRIVAQVLDFSPEERSRTGLDQQPGSWLTSIANFLAPPPSNIRVASKVDVLDHSSLSQAFIRFLEEESSPRIQPQLPALQMAEEAKQKAQKKSQIKNAVAMAETAEATTSQPGAITVDATPAPGTEHQHQQQLQPPTDSTGHLLLSNASSTISSTFPVISTPAVSTAPLLNAETSTSKYLNNLLNVKQKDSVQDSNS